VNPTGKSLGFAKRRKIDAQLLALLVKVAALEAKSAGNIGHVEILAANFSEEHFAFEGCGALLETSLPCGRAAGGLSKGSHRDRR